MRKLLSVAFLLLLLASASAQVSPTTALQQATAYQSVSDRNLAIISAYSMTVSVLGVVTPSAALSSAAAYQGLDDRSLQVIQAWALAQLTGGLPAGGIFNVSTGAFSFTTNWVSIINTNRAGGYGAGPNGAPTNFTDMQFVRSFNGSGNGAMADNSAVLSGLGNCATGIDSVVCGGFGGVAGGTYSFVGSGLHGCCGSRAFGDGAGVVSGQDCTAMGNESFIGSGNDNVIGTTLPADKAGCQYSAIVGGFTCGVNGQNSFIGGGQNNFVGQFSSTAHHSAVVGGSGNVVDDNSQFSFVGGGDSNHAQGTNTFIGGGHGNTANVNMAAILGGQGNTVSGSNSMAIGSTLTIANNNEIGLGYGGNNPRGQISISSTQGVLYATNIAPVGFNPTCGQFNYFVTNITAGIVLINALTNVDTTGTRWFDFTCAITNSHGSGGPFAIVLPNNVHTNAAGTVLQLTNVTYVRFSGIGGLFTNGFGQPQY